jgi:tetratricopeptide (TPR) repeat protein
LLNFCTIQRFVAATLACTFLAAGVRAADSSEGQFSTSITLFSTLAAINAAGYDVGMDSPLNARYRIRSQIRDVLAKRNIPCLAELKAFYKEHKKASDTADLSQYISFGLVAGGPPNFAVNTAELPPDVQALAGFSDLLSRFYKEADLNELWRRAQPAFSAAIANYQDSVINSIFETDGYLRNPSGYLGRGFQIFIDLLGAPDQVQVRSYRDDYFVVVTPTSSPAIDEIRDAYLSYALDPLSFQYIHAIDEKKALQKIAQEAPALDLAYKDDFTLLVTKCLVKAIDSRLMHAGAEQRQAFVNNAVRQGFILTAAFAELLPQYEKSQDSFRLFYPDLIAKIDVKKEEKRLKNVEFAKSAPVRIVAPPAKLQLSPAEQLLASAEGLFQQHDTANAEKAFKQATQQTTNPELLGRAYYGLGLIALEEKHWDEAVSLFQRELEKSPNSAAGAWSHYYLGQLDLKAGDPAQAVAQFKLTLATEGVSARARQAAEEAIQANSSTSEGGQKP